MFLCLIEFLLCRYKVAAKLSPDGATAASIRGVRAIPHVSAADRRTIIVPGVDSEKVNEAWLTQVVA
jgi:hypothetical protein